MSTTIWDDRQDAYEAATESASWLRELQSTETWQHLPHDVRVTLCRAHATLEAMSTAMVDAEMV